MQTGDEALLGQIDGVESGEVTGWACLRGYMAKPLEVRCSSALALVLHMLLHQCLDFVCSLKNGVSPFCTLGQTVSP